MSGCRSSSLSLSPAQHRRENNYFRTPPISREKHKITTKLIDGPRVAGHVYRHLQEDDSKDLESVRRWIYFCFVCLFLSRWFNGTRGGSPSAPGSNRGRVMQTGRVTEVKWEWQKDYFDRNEFMTENVPSWNPWTSLCHLIHGNRLDLLSPPPTGTVTINLKNKLDPNNIMVPGKPKMCVCACV